MHVLHLLVAPPVLGHTLGRPTTLAPEGFECSKCGEREGSGSNCCFDGGAWEGMCEEGGQHTYSEGFQACNGNPYLKRNEEESRQKGLTRFSTAEKLNEMFRNAVVGNDLEKVGLLFHGFDAERNQPWAPYKPCRQGYCARFSDEWPGSIINAHQRHTSSNTGILLAPVCSFSADRPPRPSD